MSTFYGFEIARSGLFASQKAIDVIGHNIANANTVGYTRQRLDLVSINPAPGNGGLAECEKGISGGGVRIASVQQIRNEFIDSEYRLENSRQQMWQTKSEALAFVEQIFDETQDTGISDCINRFFGSINDLVNNPVDKEYRTNLVQNALKMTETFNHFSTRLVEKQALQDEAVKMSVDYINDIASSVAMLNNQIMKSESGGIRANDLRDKRNLALDRLSSIVGIECTVQSDSTVTVITGGKVLVEGSTANRLEAIQGTHNPVTGLNDLYTVTWQDDGSQLATDTGSLKGYLDMRDGDGTAANGIPYYIANLDKLASAIASEVNAVHSSGWTMPDTSNGNVSITGCNFFEVPTDGAGNPIPITASNLTLSTAILNNCFNIAASSTQITDDSLKGNNINALVMYQLIDKDDMPDIGSISGYVKGMAAGIAIDTAHSDYMLEGQTALVQNLSNRRVSISGVSIDEEVTEMMKYQHAYSAAARVITAIDEMLDTLVNRTGITGR